MARKFLDQMTAWMVGITGASAIYGAGYGLYIVGLKSATEKQNDKIARLVAESSEDISPTEKSSSGTQLDGHKAAGHAAAGHAAAGHAAAGHDASERGTTKKTETRSDPLVGSNSLEWSYSGSTGPNKWGALDRSYALCGNGKNQSPVDISATFTDNKSLPISFFYAPSRIKLENIGHSIRGTFTNLANHISLDGERFDLVHFQLRSPAEHRLQDGTLMFELQLVHRTDADKTAIISVLFNSGETNKALADVFNKMPEDKGSEFADLLSFDPMSVLPKKKAFYTYSGSLTEPPCTEGVIWIVMQTQLELSPSQNGKFSEVIGKNARPIQSINSRRIKLVPR
jgi:carbonic anhydrase